MSGSNEHSRGERALRLWPGVSIVALQWSVWWLLPLLVAGTVAGYGAVLGAAAGWLLAMVWWVGFSKAPAIERLLAPLAMAAGGAATLPLLDESVRTAGQGMLFYFTVLPWLSLALVGWAVWSQGRSHRKARIGLVVAVAAVFAGWLCVRMEGTHSLGAHYAWRWAPTAEERLLGLPADQVAARADGTASSAALWPGFRGPSRDGIVPSTRIETDWTASPPRERWRRPVGPGWSSFAVGGDLLYTQEQRGDEEWVSCYRLSSGEPVWHHASPARFWEANAGAGPRGTPTLENGVVYSLGATGLLNALDAVNGRLRWSRDVSADTGEEIPIWGFSASPLLLDGRLYVAAAGRLVAYEAASGELAWLGPEGGNGYSSPHRMEFEGAAHVVLLGGEGAAGFDPESGELLWRQEWPGFPIVQPATAANGDLLIGSDQTGLGRYRISSAAGGWSSEERWQSNRLKPYFSDYVVHEGHAYGFDGNILAAVDLADGERRWKGGRYGHGQLLLLADRDLLLVLTEKGELALVAARPDGFEEIARRPVLGGKTWNHPVLVEGVLLVRNGEEMAAFDVG